MYRKHKMVFKRCGAEKMERNVAMIMMMRVTWKKHRIGSLPNCDRCITDFVF